jgi:hypothetical protein
MGAKTKKKKTEKSNTYYFPVPEKHKDNFISALEEIQAIWDSGEYPYPFIEWLQNSVKSPKFKKKV